MKKQRHISLVGLVAHLVKQAKGFHQRTTRQMTGKAVGPKSPAAVAARPEERPPGADNTEMTRPVSEAGADISSTEEAASELPVEATESRPAPVDGGSAAGRDFANRIDSARSRIEGRSDSDGELQGLLEQAVGLLEMLSAHPAIRDYAATKRKLDEIEQRLGYGSYPQ